MKYLKLSSRRIADLPDATLLELAGTLDETTLTEFENYWQELDRQAGRQLRLDFGQVTHLSAFGLGFVVGYLRTLAARHEVQLVNLPASLHKVLEKAPPEVRSWAEPAAAPDCASADPALHHFALLPAVSEAVSGQPFGLRVEARDGADRTVRAYTGTAHLSSDRGLLSPTLISGFADGAWQGEVIVTGPDEVRLRAWDGPHEGSLVLRVTELGEQVEFPITVACPGCRKENIAGKADIMRCLRCNQIYYVDAQGHVVPLRSGNHHAAGFVKQLEFVIPSDINYLNHVRNFIVGISREESIGEDKVAQIEMSLDEALANVVEHAYSYDCYQDIQVTVSLHSDRLVISIRDHGRSFDEENTPVPDIHEHIQQRRVGGLGRYLIKTLMDEVEYVSDAYANELRMVKRF